MLPITVLIIPLAKILILKRLASTNANIVMSWSSFAGDVIVAISIARTVIQARVGDLKNNRITDTTTAKKVN